MRRILAVVAVVLLAVSPALSDQVADELRAALEKWEKGDGPGAHDHVRMADAKMSEQEAQGASKAWGEVPGYTLELGDAVAIGAAMMGGAISSSAEYTDAKGNTMSGTVVANSPMIGMLTGMFSNTFMAQASGASIERVGNQKVAFQLDDDLWTGNLPYKGTVLITIEGQVKKDVQKAFEVFHYDVIDKTLIME